MSSRCALWLALPALLLLYPRAHAEPAGLLTVTVEASRTSQLGLADSANQGSITGRELELRTVYRPAEILEATPGLIVGQHSGEGKASQYYLRGFNLDHGTDLATFVDDMPVNQRSHAHGQGWTDLNFLIPELVGRMDYSKGPYSARLGDFASAGSVTVNYANRLPDNIATLSGGQHGYGRAALAASTSLASGSLLYALESVHNNGPYTRGDNYRKVNGVLRYSEGQPSNGWSVTAMAYRGRWNSTDQIPLRAVQDGSIGRFDAIDNTDGGNSSRASLSATWRNTTAQAASKLNAYVIRNRLDLFSDFTYFMEDPVNGDQFGQPDRRVSSGFGASHTWRDVLLLGQASDWTLGATGQNDNVFNGLNHTRAQQVLSATRKDHIIESSAALYLENATRWSDRLRSVAGLRTDRYRYDVSSNLAPNSGVASAGLLSPSLSLIFSPLEQTELYLNLGKGFHSNDARGTVATLDVRTGEALAPVPGLVQSRGQEVGLRTELIPRMQTALSLYRLDFDSELTYIGDSGTTEAGRPSRRYGIELSNYYKVLPWLSIDVDAAYAHARSRDHDALAGDYIEDAVEGVGQLALTVDKLGPWSGAVRVRYFGPRPLTSDNRVRSRSSFTLNGHVAYQLAPKLRLSLEAFNIANRKVSAIDYYYSSQLRGEAAPVDDVHFHPSESRSLRATLIANW
ncbi:TonB-dependent receptor [Duganella qianjiadongensis]|uniref:TonB-dependent receptor n=1 Tax=Duganella qianjiadongensis TaxID=2692176 RepID=A0ABW9VEG3_9BURK|nr:TonB-dependent receptor [Duganella qianjiadongensis]MYM37946.1 TonB-dependent receptor [Duganella qianjiadongensis]